MVNSLAGKYGAHIDTDGHVIAGPVGSPRIRDLAHLREEIGETALTPVSEAVRGELLPAESRLHREVRELLEDVEAKERANHRPA